MGRTVLVLAPHTDDGEFGCGASIAKFCRDGDEVHYVAFSAAEQSVLPDFPPDVLRTEVRAAVVELGVSLDHLVLYDFGVRTFPAHRQAILERMVELNHDIQPDIVLLPSANDTHQDHATVAAEGFRAFKRTTMLGYEIPWNNLDFRTSCFIAVDEEAVERKVRALGKYQSQQHRSYASEEYIRSLLITRGTQIGQRYAEAFEVIRWVIG